MYKRRNGQTSILESPVFFEGVKLDPENQWLKLAALTPWDEIEAQYAQYFARSVTGNPAKSSRMAVGTLIIKERYGFSDEDVVEEIRMNPYLQYYIGMPAFTHEAPFDASTITRFRKRVTPQMLREINDIVIERAQTPKDPEASPDDPPDNTPPTDGQTPSTRTNPRSESEPANEGTMILDATCAPQNIRYPTDMSLLNEGREKLEAMIDGTHTAGFTQEKKPRMYRKRARWDYLRYARNRKPGLKLLRKSLRKQLGYIARDLGYLDQILKQHPNALSSKQQNVLSVIRTLYRQQLEMYEGHTHTIKDRIVSISQPHVRPIVRGKARADTEFGAKVEASLVNGYARIEKLSWDAFNEGSTLQESVERFKADTGLYPRCILADKIFRTRENLDYCKKHQIRLSGPKLGRPPKDEALAREQRQIEREESGERSAIEGWFGIGKRRYTLGCIMTRLQHTSEVSIHVIVLTMNLFRKLRLSISLFFRRLWSELYPVSMPFFTFVAYAFIFVSSVGRLVQETLRIHASLGYHSPSDFETLFSQLPVA